MKILEECPLSSTHHKTLKTTAFCRYLLYRHSSHNREFHNVNCRFCGAIHNVDRAYISVGDWYVNEKKLGETLGGLVKRVNDLGVKFGIWIEPEMISEDSDLYREHPDWALTIPGRKPVRSRNQCISSVCPFRLNRTVIPFSANRSCNCCQLRDLPISFFTAV